MAQIRFSPYRRQEIKTMVDEAKIREAFRVVKKKGVITILQSQFFITELRQLGGPICVLLAVLIDSKLTGYHGQIRHWREGLEVMSRFQ